MFLSYYKLASQPFGVTPDLRYLYMSPTHREAMASVFSGVMQNRGFTALIADPGMGKTTLLFDLLQRLPSSLKTVFLFQTQCSANGLLRSILQDLGVQDAGDDFSEMQGKLNEALLQKTSQGSRIIILVDEAQNLDEPILEALRVLSNFETGQEKLLHIVLAGQPQLAKKLASQAMVQLRQRISVVARIAPFKADETRAYIEHRLHIAGHRGGRPLFTNRAYDLIAIHSGGVPRNISNICFNAMTIGCALHQKMIRSEVICEALRDLDLLTLFDEGGQTEAARMPAFVGKVSPRKAKSKSPHTARMLLALSTAAVAACLLFSLAYGHARAASLGEIFARVGARAGVIKAGPVPSVEINTPVSSVQSLNRGAANWRTTATNPVSPRPAEIESKVRIVSNESKDTFYNHSPQVLGRYGEQVPHDIQELSLFLSNSKRIRLGPWIQMPAGENHPHTNEDGSQSPILEGKKHE